jgi:integrase
MSALKADKGKLLLDFSWKSVRCREYLGLDDAKEGRAQAKKIKTQVDGEIVAGTFDFAKWFPKAKKARTLFAPPAPPPSPEGPPSFGTFAREWLELQRPAGSHAHYLDRKSLLETHLIPFFGAERRMGDFAVEDVERFRNHLKTLPGLKRDAVPGERVTMSGVRVNKARALLSKLLDRAVKKGWLRDNPVLDVERLREDHAVIDPLSFEDVRLLLDKGLKHDPEMRRFYTVAFFTGLRTSELIGLKWADLTLTSTPPRAHITRSFTKHDGLHATKTEGSVRYVDLRRQVVQALTEQKAATRLKSEYVFCSGIGGPLDRDNVANRIWYPALMRAEIKARKPYQTRHTFATLALSAGEEIGWVAKQLGHKNTEMVIRHYYVHIKNNTRQDGSALDKAAAMAGL